MYQTRSTCRVPSAGVVASVFKIFFGVDAMVSGKRVVLNVHEVSVFPCIADKNSFILLIDMLLVIGSDDTANFTPGTRLQCLVATFSFSNVRCMDVVVSAD